MQEIIDRAVRLATKNAMNGTPLRRVLWIEPESGSDDPKGIFSIEYEPDICCGSKLSSWES